jgi:hypothetical protein
MHITNENWRVIGIWFSGLVASGLLGGIFVDWLLPYRGDAELGIIAGAALFCCVRLWRAPVDREQWRSFKRWQALEQERKDWPDRTISRVK